MNNKFLIFVLLMPQLMIASESKKQIVPTTVPTVVHRGFEVGASYSMSPITPPWQTTQSIGSPSDHQPCRVRSYRSQSDAATCAQKERLPFPSDTNPAALTTADDWRRDLARAWTCAAASTKHNPTEGVAASDPSTPVRPPALGRTTTPKTPGLGTLDDDNAGAADDDGLQFDMEA